MPDYLATKSAAELTARRDELASLFAADPRQDVLHGFYAAQVNMIDAELQRRSSLPA